MINVTTAREILNLWTSDNTSDIQADGGRLDGTSLKVGFWHPATLRLYESANSHFGDEAFNFSTVEVKAAADLGKSRLQVIDTSAHFTEVDVGEGMGGSFIELFEGASVEVNRLDVGNPKGDPDAGLASVYLWGPSTLRINEMLSVGNQPGGVGFVSVNDDSLLYTSDGGTIIIGDRAVGNFNVSENGRVEANKIVIGNSDFNPPWASELLLKNNSSVEVDNLEMGAGKTITVLRLSDDSVLDVNYTARIGTKNDQHIAYVNIGGDTELRTDLLEMGFGGKVDVVHRGTIEADLGRFKDANVDWHRFAVY